MSYNKSQYLILPLTSVLYSLSLDLITLTGFKIPYFFIFFDNAKGLGVKPGCFEEHPPMFDDFKFHSPSGETLISWVGS